jgi:hypothetical protein
MAMVRTALTSAGNKTQIFASAAVTEATTTSPRLPWPRQRPPTRGSGSRRLPPGPATRPSASPRSRCECNQHKPGGPHHPVDLLEGTTQLTGLKVDDRVRAPRLPRTHRLLPAARRAGPRPAPAEDTGEKSLLSRGRPEPAACTGLTARGSRLRTSTWTDSGPSALGDSAAVGDTRTQPRQAKRDDRPLNRSGHRPVNIGEPVRCWLPGALTAASQHLGHSATTYGQER